MGPGVPLRGERLRTSAGHLLNFGAFYLGWFACVGGVAGGRPYLGPLVVGVLLAIHLSLSRHRRREALLILCVGTIGFAIDTASAWGRLYSFVTEPGAVVCPPWLTALWMNFASTLNASLSWLAGRYALAAALSAAAGPLSYLAAMRFGVIEFPDTFRSLAVLAAIWAVTTPGLLCLAAALGPRPRPR